MTLFTLILSAGLWAQSAPHQHKAPPQAMPGLSSCQVECLTGLAQCSARCSQQSKEKDTTKAHVKCVEECSKTSDPCLKRCGDS
jgi:hypothetical protein